MLRSFADFAGTLRPKVSGDIAPENVFADFAGPLRPEVGMEKKRF